MDRKTALRAAVFPLLLPLAAYALDVTPDRVFLCGAPGETVRADLSILNDSPEPVRVALEAHADSGKTWFGLGPRSFRLAPGARRVSRLKARVPVDPGERGGEIWARVFQSGAMEETRVIRRVTLRVAGTEIYEASIENLTAHADKGRVVVTADFENRGNVSLRPKAVAELARRNGALVRAAQDLTAAPVPPGARAPLCLEAALDGADWSGGGTLSCYFRDDEGKTLQILKTIGEAERAAR